MHKAHACVTLRLCLVHVKAFPENIPIFGKENVFMCLVAFQKIFRKIFFGVWKRRKEETNSEKHGQNPEKKIINDRLASSTRGEIAIDWV